MNFPSLNFRDLIYKKNQERLECEKDFEKNIQEFTDCVVNEFAKTTLKRFQENIQNYQTNYRPICEFLMYLDFDITKPENLEPMERMAKACNTLSPFNKWIEKSSIIPGLEKTSRAYLYGLMGRVAILAGEKLKTIMHEYTLNPLHNILKFTINLIQTELTLNLNINVKENWPVLEGLKTSSWLKILQANEPFLPSIDLRELAGVYISKKNDFEKNVNIYANSITNELIKVSLNQLENTCKFPYLGYPTKENPSQYVLGFDLKKKSDVLKHYYHYNFDVNPFKNLLKNLANPHNYYGVYIDQSFLESYKESMMSVAFKVVSKLNEKLDEYTSEPMQNIMKYEAKFCETDLQLTLNLWIDEESDWPMIAEKTTNNNLTIPLLNIPFSIQDAPKQKKSFFDDYF